MLWTRENIAGLKLDRPWKYLLIPGAVVQWFIYMFPSGAFSSVVSETRHARSPIMTFVYSAGFWLLLLFAIFGALSGSR
ncbi:hypothetical protein IVB56_27240 [Bradyrhizobium sp. CW7]|uniref:hypothetical protein n=1 Tax=Bradyrhizobium sp. CW7 TaxID=2782688 RepID=UPI001FF75786|nr:hypothetical protein [Bradyrhizobium sp. CW7]MCK1354643.1 hypothetical protein [Bradyrhizobium sp. CW7]